MGNIDTGWVTIPWSNDFTTHSTGHDLKARRVGKIVQMTGCATPKRTMTIDADNAKTICILPEQFRPKTSLAVLCQGSQMAVFLLDIGASGTV